MFSFAFVHDLSRQSEAALVTFHLSRNRDKWHLHLQSEIMPSSNNKHTRTHTNIIPYVVKLYLTPDLSTLYSELKPQVKNISDRSGRGWLKVPLVSLRMNVPMKKKKKPKLSFPWSGALEPKPRSRACSSYTPNTGLEHTFLFAWYRTSPLVALCIWTQAAFLPIAEWPE